MVPYTFAQKGKAIVKGKIMNSDGEVVPYVSITELNSKTIVQASSVGEYIIRVPSDTVVIIEFKALGYATQRFTLKLRPREIKELQPLLVSETKEYAGAIIKEDRNREKISTITINPKDAKEEFYPQ